MIQRARELLNRLAHKVNLHEAYYGTFTSPDGKLVLQHLIKVGHVTSSTFVAGDPNMTAFREGQRHIVLSILRNVNKDTTALIKQIEEGLQHED